MIKISTLSFWEKYISIDLGVGVIPNIIKDMSDIIGHQKIQTHIWRDKITEQPERRVMITSNFVQKTVQFPLWHAHDTLFPHPLQKVRKYYISGSTLGIPAGSIFQIVNLDVEGYVDNILLSADKPKAEYWIIVDDKEYYVSSVSYRIENNIDKNEFEHSIILSYSIYPTRYTMLFVLPIYIRRNIRIKVYNAGTDTIEFCQVFGYAYGYKK